MKTFTAGVCVLLTVLCPSLRLEAQMHSSLLPSHSGARTTSLGSEGGRRVEIHSQNPDLTQEECRALILRYQALAAPDGQVSVRKPSKRFNGQMVLWCIENFDGKGVTFNDALFN